MEKNRYYKTTAGIDQLSFVAKTGFVYGGGATTQFAFQATGAEGAIAVINTATGAVLPGTAATDPQAVLQILLKRNSATESSTTFQLSKTKVTKVAAVPAVPQVWTITAGSGGGAPVVTVGNVWVLKLTELTTLNQPFPYWSYQHVVKVGDTVQTILADFAAQINSTISPQNRGNLIATATSTATTLVITSRSASRWFTVATSQDMYNNGFTAAITTQFNFGQGIPDQVLLMDAESNVKKGVTTNYPINGVPSEYGLPFNYVDTTKLYVDYVIVDAHSEDSPTPVDKHFRRNHQHLFVPSDAAAAIALLDVIFGLADPA